MWCSNDNTTAKNMSLLRWSQISVIMGNLQSLYLRCRLPARCEGTSEGKGEGFSAAFEVLGGIDKPCSETWAGMKTSWNNQCLHTLQTKSVFFSFWCNSHVGSAHSLAHQSLSTAEQCSKRCRKADQKSKMSVSRHWRLQQLTKCALLFVFRV